MFWVNRFGVLCSIRLIYERSINFS